MTAPYVRVEGVDDDSSATRKAAFGRESLVIHFPLPNRFIIPLSEWTGKREAKASREGIFCFQRRIRLSLSKSRFTFPYTLLSWFTICNINKIFAYLNGPQAGLLEVDIKDRALSRVDETYGKRIKLYLQQFDLSLPFHLLSIVAGDYRY